MSLTPALWMIADLILLLPLTAVKVSSVLVKIDAKLTIRNERKIALQHPQVKLISRCLLLPSSSLTPMKVSY